MTSTPSWAKNLSHIIKDSRAYQAVANNSRTISYLVGITGTVYAIVSIARVYLKMQEVQEELQANLTKLQTNFDNEKAAYKENKNKLEAFEKEKNLLAEKLKKAETELNTKETNLQEIGKEVTNMREQIKTLLAEKNLLAEELKKAKTELNAKETNLQEIGKEVTNMREQNKTLLAEKNQLAEELKKAKTELNTKETNLQEIKKEVTDMRKQNETLLAEKNKLSEKLQQAQDKLKLNPQAPNTRKLSLDIGQIFSNSKTPSMLTSLNMQSQDSFQIPKGHSSSRLSGSTLAAASKMLSRSMTPDGSSKKI